LLAGARLGVENAIGASAARKRAVPTEKEDDMSTTLRQLLAVSATCVLASAAYAQTTATPAPVTPKTSDQAYSDYEAAAKACGAKTGLARSDCIRDARDAYDKAMETANPTMGGGHGSPNGSGGTSGTGGAKNVKS
jgi:hypothetical protein